MNSDQTYAKIFARIVFELIPTIFCAVVCISAAFTHALDKWIFPCGIYMAFMALLELIGVIVSAVAAYNEDKAWQIIRNIY